MVSWTIVTSTRGGEAIPTIASGAENVTQSPIFEEFSKTFGLESLSGALNAGTSSGQGAVIEDDDVDIGDWDELFFDAQEDVGAPETKRRKRAMKFVKNGLRQLTRIGKQSCKCIDS